MLLPLTKKNIGIPYVYGRIISFLREYERRANYASQCSECPIDLFFDYPNDNYKDAIWIKVKNKNGNEIWFFINVTNPYQEYSLKIFSRIQLRFSDRDPVKNYGFPPSYKKENIYVYELIPIKPAYYNTMTYTVLDKMCLELPYLCEV